MGAFLADTVQHQGARVASTPECAPGAGGEYRSGAGHRPPFDKGLPLAYKCSVHPQVIGTVTVRE